MRTPALAIALPLLLLQGCADVRIEEIALRLTTGNESACGRALSSGGDPQSKLGVYAVHLLMVRRVSKQMYTRCVETWGAYTELAQLQGRLRAEITFENVQEGSWDLWVVGSNTRCTDQMTETRLCGTSILSIPPPAPEIALSVSCEDPFSDQATLEAMKRQITQCKIGMPPLPRP